MTSIFPLYDVLGTSKLTKIRISAWKYFGNETCFVSDWQWSFRNCFTWSLVILILTWLFYLKHALIAECRLNDTGSQYIGQVSVTSDNISCQQWDAQTPHQHNFTSDALFRTETVTQASNFCRNPLGSGRDDLWCFTVEPTIEWQYCNVPLCGKCMRCNDTYRAWNFQCWFQLLR